MQCEISYWNKELLLPSYLNTNYHKNFSMPTNIRSENVNNSFFDGHYKDIWRHVFPEKTTLAEVDFIVEEAKLNPGHHVLDIMCGYGRHTLELANRK